MDEQDPTAELVITFTTRPLPALVTVDLFQVEKDTRADNTRSRLIASSNSNAAKQASRKRISAAAQQPAGATIRMTLLRPASTPGEPVRNIVFESEVNVLGEMDDDILTAFESESGDGLAQLPKNNRYISRIQSVF